MAQHGPKLEILRENLKIAQLEYALATTEYRRLASIMSDTVSTADGPLAFQQAKRIHERSAEAWRTALSEFSDYILHGKSPKPD